MSEIPDWPFKIPQNVVVFTTEHIVNDKEPILLVLHEVDDGAWQFHSRDVVREQEFMAITIAELVEMDPTIKSLADLPLGWKAFRNSPTDPWTRQPV